MAIFEHLLKGIFDACGAETQEEQEKYLYSLREDAIELWKSYQTQEISVQYKRKEIQDSYLLRYYPFYSLLLLEVLCSLPQGTTSSFKQEVFQATFFGCGPAPELLGLLVFLKEKEPEVAMAFVNLVDIDIHTWSHARNISLDYIVSRVWDSDLIDTTRIESDISGTELTEPNSHILKCAGESNLIVYQNCLNELSPEQLVRAFHNIKQIIMSSQTGSITIIIERSGYWKTEHKLQELFQWAMDSTDVQPVGCMDCSANYFHCRSITDGTPDIIKRNLYRPYDGNLDSLVLPYKIKYISGAFKRIPPDDSQFDDGLPF